MFLTWQLFPVSTSHLKACNFIIKKDSNIGASCGYCKNFKKTYFEEHLFMAASESHFYVTWKGSLYQFVYQLLDLGVRNDRLFYSAVNINKDSNSKNTFHKPGSLYETASWSILADKTSKNSLESGVIAETEQKMMCVSTFFSRMWW